MEAGFTEKVEEFEMTDKQRENMQVSPHDNRSPLGKRFLKLRKERKKDPVIEQKRKEKARSKAKVKRKQTKKSKKQNRK